MKNCTVANLLQTFKTWLQNNPMFSWTTWTVRFLKTSSTETSLIETSLSTRELSASLDRQNVTKFGIPETRD
jgi:hypothetical protein